MYVWCGCCHSSVVRGWADMAGMRLSSIYTPHCVCARLFPARFWAPVWCKMTSLIQSKSLALMHTCHVTYENKWLVTTIHRGVAPCRCCWLLTITIHSVSIRKALIMALLLPLHSLPCHRVSLIPLTMSVTASAKAWFSVMFVCMYRMLQKKVNCLHARMTTGTDRMVTHMGVLKFT